MTVAGPSQSGKSTFTYNLLKNAETHITTTFDKITICVGTQIEGNILADLSDLYPGKVEIISVREKYPSDKDQRVTFPEDFKAWAQDKQEMKLNRCVIFDDLMTELGRSDLLLNIFTKYSSHCNLSCINIMQNLFPKLGGGDNTSVYRNTRYVVYFTNPLDVVGTRVLAQHLGAGKDARSISAMIKKVTLDYKYIVIDGDIRREPLDGSEESRVYRIKFTSDLFSENPFVFKRVFEPIS